MPEAMRAPLFHADPVVGHAEAHDLARAGERIAAHRALVDDLEVALRRLDDALEGEAVSLELDVDSRARYHTGRRWRLDVRSDDRITVCGSGDRELFRNLAVGRL